MPFFVGDYLRDTMHLSTEEHGAYLLLIMACWNSDGKVKNTDKHCSSIARVTLEQWASIKDAILPFFLEKDGFLIHDKVSRIKAEASQKYEKRKEAGAKGGRAKSLNNKEDANQSSSNDEESDKANKNQSSSNATDKLEQSSSNALAKGVANGKQKPSNQNQNQNQIDKEILSLANTPDIVSEIEVLELPQKENDFFLSEQDVVKLNQANPTLQATVEEMQKFYTLYSDGKDKNNQPIKNWQKCFSSFVIRERGYQEQRFKKSNEQDRIADFVLSNRAEVEEIKKQGEYF